MKRLIVLFLALTLCLSACAALPSSSGNKRTVAMICDSTIDDGGWGEACYKAMVRAAGDRGWDCRYTDAVPQDGYYDALADFCEEGVTLLYVPGNQYTQAVLQAAEAYPDVSFALLNGTPEVPGQAVNKNVLTLLPNTQQIGWIAGAMAGLMTRTGTIAFIGGMELQTTREKYESYAQAAQYVAQQEGKEIRVLDCAYAGSYNDYDRGRTLAAELMGQGADVFFGDASAVDSGARETIDQANADAGEPYIFDIAQPADLLGQNECVILSQVTDNAALLAAAMEAVENDAFGGETLYGTLQNQALSAGGISELVPAELREKYMEYLEQMVDDTFMK